MSATLFITLKSLINLIKFFIVVISNTPDDPTTFKVFTVDIPVINLTKCVCVFARLVRIVCA